MVDKVLVVVVGEETGAVMVDESKSVDGKEDSVIDKEEDRLVVRVVVLAELVEVVIDWANRARGQAARAVTITASKEYLILDI
jgi:hypothetical protein